MEGELFLSLSLSLTSLSFSLLHADQEETTVVFSLVVAKLRSIHIHRTPDAAECSREKPGVDAGREGGGGRRCCREEAAASCDCGSWQEIRGGQAPGIAAGQWSGLQQQQETGCSLVNGHRCGLDEKESSPCTGGEVSKQPEPATEVAAGEPPVSNGAAAPVAPAVTVAAKEGKSVGNGNGGVAKKRRGGPAVLMEGSRCSRVNGRGWRCSQPTLVGYALCEHHLGKGRMRSVTGAAAAGGRGGASQLGRTEHTRLPTTTPTPRIPATAPPTSRAP
uniref:WRC domain-containing protein n=1 Tax=Oryza brachyantha TaxID=4533 RepID=J3MC79_ORYBR